MNIEIYTLCHQEAKIIPYFMRHYNQYGQVFMFEGHSTDGSAELARSLGAIIIPTDTGNEVNDNIFTDIKNNCWKQSVADWVIVCDMDEFVYHPNFVAYLETIKDSTIIIPINYEMFSDVFPTTQGQIYEEVNMGFPYDKGSGTKFFLFKPREITSMNYSHGCHSASPEGNVSVNLDTEIIAMHFKHLSLEYVTNQRKYLWTRMSETNKRNGWGWHVGLPSKVTEDYINNNKSRLIKVI